ncbi:MAG TPA: molybdopterin-dependent oxidoreductase, partial [Chitinophagaceae bacterium]|nr:molybdopterin-dependent oxidoreductase [Chitinophagaceae bacterium]
MNKSNLITRRTALITGLTSLGSILLPGCTKPLPPTYGNILRMGDVLTYTAHRALLPGQSLVKEYSHREISSFPATGSTNPSDPDKSYMVSEAYGGFLKNSFSDWKLSIEGRVARPVSYSLSDLQSFPARRQITRHTCEEGWTAIAEWTGVPLSLVLANAGIMPSARFVNFYSYDGVIDSIDMMDAFHPQTI